MKFIYVAGLEHSGTTLLSQMLANGETVLSLGEMGRFFSPSHMQQYIRQWGEYPDSQRCSCGKDWAECAFWSEHLDLSGLTPDNDASVTGRYESLLDRLRITHEPCTIVDSSKSLESLEASRTAWTRCGLPSANFLVLLIYKDPRAFVHSQGRKSGQSPGLLHYLRWSNLWAGSYLRYLDSLPALGSEFRIVSYSRLCAKPSETLDGLIFGLGGGTEDWSRIDHSNSHIAMGNKDFTERNRIEIREDRAWERVLGARLVYRLNPRARRVAATLSRLEAQMEAS